jgi:hypothetical protein
MTHKFIVFIQKVNSQLMDCFILLSSSFIPLDEVNYSWLDKDLGIEDVPKMSSSDLVNYLRSEIKV